MRRNLFTRFSFDPGYESGVTPSPDGKTLYFTGANNGEFSLVKKEIGGSGEGEVILESTMDMYPTSVSPDGEYLSFFKGGDETNYDIWILPLSGDAEAYPFIETEFVRGSRDVFTGRTLACLCVERVRQPRDLRHGVPRPGEKVADLDQRWAVTTVERERIRNSLPRVRRDDHAVRVEPRDGGLLIGEATPLYNTRLQPYGNYFWALSPDGERVLAMETGSEHDAPNLSVVVNWLDAVRQGR